MSTSLSLSDASRYARLALANIDREFPAKLDHVIGEAAHLASPRALHPSFFGSFDWHSCVHAHWLLARLLKLYRGCRRLPRSAACSRRGSLRPTSMRSEPTLTVRKAVRSNGPTAGPGF
jgi:hypothetical protein